MRSLLTAFSLLIFLSLYGLQVHAADGRVGSAVPPGSLWDTQWGPLKAGLKDANLDMEFFLNGELGGELELIQALRRGRLQMIGVSLAGLVPTIPEASLALAPYQFEDADQIEFIYNGYLFPALKKAAKDKGMVLLAWNEVGWSHLYATRPIRVPNDVRDLAMRAPQNVPHQAFLTALGADNVPLALPDIVPALQTGLIQGGMANVILHTAMSAAYAKHYTLTGHIYDTSVFLAERGWYDDLTQSQKDAIDGVFHDQVLGRQYIRTEAKKVLDDLSAQSDVDVYQPTPGELERWRQAGREARTSILGEIGPRGEELQSIIEEGRAAFAARQADR